MKKVFSLIAGLALMLGASSSLEAQSRDLKFTASAGVAFPKVSSSQADLSIGLTTTPFVYAGVDYALPSNSQIHLEGGLEWKLIGTESLFKNKSYLSLPVSVRYVFTEEIPVSLGAGAYIGKSLVEDSKLDYGLLIKARYDFAQRFFGTLQYNLGLKDLGESKLHVFQIGVGVNF